MTDIKSNVFGVPGADSIKDAATGELAEVSGSQSIDDVSLSVRSPDSMAVKDLLKDISTQLRVMNFHLSLLTEVTITPEDVQ